MNTLEELSLAAKVDRAREMWVRAKDRLDHAKNVARAAWKGWEDAAAEAGQAMPERRVDE